MQTVILEDRVITTNLSVYQILYLEDQFYLPDFLLLPNFHFICVHQINKRQQKYHMDCLFDQLVHKETSDPISEFSIYSRPFLFHRWAKEAGNHQSFSNWKEPLSPQPSYFYNSIQKVTYLHKPRSLFFSLATDIWSLGFTFEPFIQQL